jgi:hypothetical protein
LTLVGVTNRIVYDPPHVERQNAVTGPNNDEWWPCHYHKNKRLLKRFMELMMICIDLLSSMLADRNQNFPVANFLTVHVEYFDEPEYEESDAILNVNEFEQWHEGFNDPTDDTDDEMQINDDTDDEDNHNSTDYSFGFRSFVHFPNNDYVIFTFTYGCLSIGASEDHADIYVDFDENISENAFEVLLRPYYEQHVLPYLFQ